MDPPVTAAKIDHYPVYLGDARAAHPDAVATSFDAVLTLTRHPHPLTTHHRPLYDSTSTTPDAFAAAMDTARALYTDRDIDPLLIHCNLGISRSATVIATLLVCETPAHDTFDEALATVRDARPRASPHRHLRQLAVDYLASR